MKIHRHIIAVAHLGCLSCNLGFWTHQAIEIYFKLISVQWNKLFT